jgi:RNA polymerase sigma-70 factor (ECF subfamily)
MTEPDDRAADLDIFEKDAATDEPPTSERGHRAGKRKNQGAVDDLQLLGDYARGDEPAFEALVAKYFRMVYTVAARQTADPHLAEEVAQSVFLILSRKARGFPSRTSLPGWLLRTTRFVCWDAIKMRRRRAANEQRLAVSLQPALEPRPEPSAMQLLLEEAVQTLRTDEQAGIVARFFEGKDFQEIAEMFQITEHAARKRTARCLVKLQNFMAKRGAKISSPALFRLLLAPPAYPATHQNLQAALQATHAVWRGALVSANALNLADHALRLLRWHRFGRLSLKLALVALLAFAAGWSVREWRPSVGARLERLGQGWGALDRRVAQHRQFLIQTPPESPNYQAQIQRELAGIGRESSRLVAELNPLLALPGERTHLAQFLTAELAETLNLDAAKRGVLFSYIQNRLAQGATLHDAMRALAEAAPSETSDVKGMLSSEQQQAFDQIYGADGVLLFSYAKATAVGTIGP